LVSALVWGTRGRRFKSGRPDEATASRGGGTRGRGRVRGTSRKDASLGDNTEFTGRASRVSDGRMVTVPNVLSGLRLASVPVFVWLFVTDKEEAAVIVYGVGAATDWVDGYVARRTGAVTELGKLLDPLADRAFILALALALLLRGALPAWLGAVIIVRDVAVLGLWPVVDRRSARRIRVNFVGKSATAALLVGLTSLALSETRWSLGRWAREIGLVATGIGGVLYWVSGMMYARAASRGGR
jgi:cardiolipin synthase (CMP-forming)